MAPPSEFDLRAALAEGEGDSLNPDNLILAGRTRRAQRRNRLLTTAAAVVLVAGGAVSVSQFDGGSAGTSNAADDAAGGGSALEPKAGAGAHGPASSNDYRYAPRNRDAGGLASSASAPSQSSLLTTIGCPSRTVADELVQQGAKSTAAQAHAAVFSTTVTSAVVCAYGSTMQPAVASSRRTARLELFGSAATRLTTSMENADLAPNPGPCGQGVANRFTVVGVGAAGARLTPVTVDLVGAACAPVLSNGTAVRYDWVPPPDLARRLSALTPTGPPLAPNPTPSS